MRVLLQLTGDGEPSAETAAMATTVERLAALGVEAELSGALAPDLSSVDLVHVFDAAVEPTFRHVVRARAADRPIVLTPNPPQTSGNDFAADLADRRNVVMRQIAAGLSDALVPRSQAELESMSSTFAVLPRRIELVPVEEDQSFAAEQMRAIYEAVMREREASLSATDWRSTFTPEQYIEHLESLIQLQLETIAVRDSHYANVREEAERAVEYARSLEADRERREEYIKSLEPGRAGIVRALADRLNRLRR